MTGYSGGARWMGIVSSRDPAPVPAVAQMRAPDLPGQPASPEALRSIRRALKSRLRSAQRRSSKSSYRGERAPERNWRSLCRRCTTSSGHRRL